MKVERIFSIMTNKNDLRNKNKNKYNKVTRKKESSQICSFDEILNAEMQKLKKLC